MGDKELLSIVECLRAYRGILFGQRLRIFTNHKNLTFATSTSARLHRWRLLIEEYGPEIVYLPGK